MEPGIKNGRVAGRCSFRDSGREKENIAHGLCAGREVAARLILHRGTSLKARQRGTVVVDLGIVLVMLGVLAFALVAQHRCLGMETRELALRGDLQVVRQAIESYRADHGGLFPAGAEGESRDSAFIRQLLRKSQQSGAPDPNGECGPYLKAALPPNPFNGMSSVLFLDTQEVQPTETTGWIYHVKTGHFRANSRRLGSNGKPLYEY